MSTIISQGSFTSAGVGVSINTPQGCDYFKTVNLTQIATTQATGRGVMFEWYGNPSFAAGSAIEWLKTNSTNALNATTVTSGGFTFVQSYPAPEAAVTGTAITAATPAVVTSTNTYSEGDRVILYNTTGMAQVGGMAFTISSVSGSGYTLLGLPAAGFSAPATALTARRIPKVNRVEPEFLYVTAISQASQGVVTVSTDPTNVVYVGQKLIFQIPASFGMTQLNNTNQAQSLPAVVTAVNYAAYQFTINVNTSAYTAFAFPASTLSPTVALFATVAPAGSSTQYNPITQTYTGYDFNKAPFRSGLFLPYMFLAAGAQSPAGSTSDVILWQCHKFTGTQYGAS